MCCVPAHDFVSHMRFVNTVCLLIQPPTNFLSEKPFGTHAALSDSFFINTQYSSHPYIYLYPSYKSNLLPCNTTRTWFMYLVSLLGHFMHTHAHTHAPLELVFDVEHLLITTYY